MRASMASTVTPGLHDAGVVPTWVLRNEATLSLIIEWARMSRVV